MSDINTMRNRFARSVKNDDEFSNFPKKFTTEEIDIFQKICDIPVLNKDNDYDINKFMEILDSIKNKETQDNVFTLLFVNYWHITLFNNHYIKEFEPFFEKYDLNLKKIDNFNVYYFGDTISFKESLINLTLSNQNLNYFNFLNKIYDLKDFDFNNKDFKGKIHFFENVNEEFHNKLIELNLYDPSKFILLGNETNVIEFLARNKPIQAEMNKKINSFNYFYKSGLEFDEKKLCKFFKTYIKNIENGFENHKENTKNLNNLVKSIPKIVESKIDKKDPIGSIDVINKTLEETKKLIEKYKEAIDLGQLKIDRNLELKNQTITRDR